MIFYPGETDDELRERLAFFSLVTPAACDFLLEAAEELGDAESVKKACDIAVALLDPARVIRSFRTIAWTIFTRCRCAQASTMRT